MSTPYAYYVLGEDGDATLITRGSTVSDHLITGAAIRFDRQGRRGYVVRVLGGDLEAGTIEAVRALNDPTVPIERVTELARSRRRGRGSSNSLFGRSHGAG